MKGANLHKLLHVHVHEWHPREESENFFEPWILNVGHFSVKVGSVGTIEAIHPWTEHVGPRTIFRFLVDAYALHVSGLFREVCQKEDQAGYWIELNPYEANDLAQIFARLRCGYVIGEIRGVWYIPCFNCFINHAAPKKIPKVVKWTRQKI